ncbi:MAG TPA: hypothetical protein VGC65_00920 [Bacteroidia bacterium]|jgi:hypothetical protein
MNIVRKAGLVILIGGVILLVVAAVDTIKEKKHDTNEERVMSHPFPWSPLIGGILVATGIIMLSRKERI